MATVALQVLHTSGNKDSPLLRSSASSACLQPPPLEWSSSPLAVNSSTSTTPGLLQSSNSKSDSSGSSTEDVPTPKDILSNAAAAIANINRKRRVVWDLRHRSSCLSSPKHRYHPYDSRKTASSSIEEAKSLTAPATEVADAVTSSSSSPSRRTSIRHRRTSSRTSSFNKPPRSILKCLRNAKVSQYSLIHSSPGKRALHPSPGGRTFFAASPTASPRRRSSTYFASTRSPGRSPGRSPRVPSLSFGIGTKSPSLADITRLNGGGRKHTVAFPDLHAPTLSDLGDAGNGSMMMSMGNAEGANMAVQDQPDASKNNNAALVNGLFGPSSSNSSLSGLAQNASSANNGTGIGLGLGQPFEGKSNDTAGELGSSNDADPRMHIISACHTLKHSLASAVWQDPSATNAPTSGQNGAVQGVVADEDCFDSQPFDFPPRNIEQVLPEQTSSPRQAPFPSVHLREIEAAYATIFQYAQVYIQAWYNVASPESASTSQAVQPVVSPASSQDNLDQEFAKLAPLVMKCVSRDIYRALHPVPVPTVEATSGMGPSDNLKDKASPTIEQTKEARQALLHRSGLSNGLTEEEVVSSSPLAFPTNSPNLSTVPAKVIPEVPKRIGRSTSEMRRRRNEINVVEAALQAFGTLISCERFWKYFDVKTLQATICEAAQIPRSTLFKGPKYRDLLSSFNWIVANQTLATPAYLVTEKTVQPLKAILDTVIDAVMATIEASTRNGEKARRVLSESFRALRTLLFAYPSHVIECLTGEKYIGKIAFFAKYLCSPTKALRDNAALVLAAIAFAVTANWDDLSIQGLGKKSKSQEMVSMELYRYWSLSPDQIELEELSRHLNTALETRLASDYHFVRLVVNTMPIILGRRFRKMERKGPHMWLSKAVELKKRDDFPNGAPTYSAAFHLMTFLHVTYAWTSSSKEVAGKHMIMLEQLKRTGEDLPLQSDGQKVEEGFWGLGEKALKVIAQNVDAVIAKPWTREAYSNAFAALETNAAVALVLSFTYAFTGLSYTAYLPAQTAQNVDLQQNPNLHRDLSKLWNAFTGKYIPQLCKASIPAVQLVGWQTLHALLRAGEEHPEEDAALRSWSMDRVANWRMLGVYASQASQALQPPELLLAECVKPSEIPSMDATWVFDNRKEFVSILQDSITTLIGDLVGQKGMTNDSLELEDWIKNEDGHPIMPTSLSNCIRAFFNTLCAAIGQQDSLAEPTDTLLELVSEMTQFTLCIFDDSRNIGEGTAPASGVLSLAGLSCSVLSHIAGLLEQVFGTHCLQATREAHPSSTAFEEIARVALAVPLPPAGDLQACSAYLSLIDFAFKANRAGPTLLEAISHNIVQSLRDEEAASPPSQMIVDLWGKTMKWAAASAIDNSAHICVTKALSDLLECAPSVFPDSRPEDSVRNAYAVLLACTSNGCPTKAWESVQSIADGSAEDSGTREIYLAWATLPLIRDLSLVKAESFLQQISKTITIAESTPQSAVWSLVDLAIELTSGLSKASGSAALNSLQTLQATLISLCRTALLSRDTKKRLYQAITEIFQQAYQHDTHAMGLDAFASLMMCAPIDDLQDFASLWNSTYGNSAEALTYSDGLKEYIQAALEQGCELRLPGWPAKSISQPAAKPASPTAERLLDTAESPSIIAESTESRDVPETPHSGAGEPDQPPFTATVPGEAAVAEEQSQQSPVVEETQLPVGDAIPATQMPNLSQIPEILDTSDIDVAEPDASSSVDSVIDETAIEVAVSLEQSFEDTDTSIVPETQVVLAAQQKDRENASAQDDRVEDGLNDEAADASLTETIPETQLPPTVENDEAGNTSRSLSPEVSEIEETQILEQVTFTIAERTGTPVVGANESSVDNTGSANIAAPIAEEGDPVVVAEPSPAHTRALDRESAHLPAETVLLDKATTATKVPAVSRPGLPSPASSITGSQTGGAAKTANRKRQIVEVVIPYRPWLPRYPSVNRLGDANSQTSATSGMNKFMSRTLSEGAAVLNAKTLTRKHSRDSADSLVSETSSDSKRQRNAQPSQSGQQKRKARLADIVHPRLSQETNRIPARNIRKNEIGPSRQIKKTTSLPTVIHARPVLDTADIDSDDNSISSDEEEDEVYVTSSPSVVRQISQASDSVEISKKRKRVRGSSHRTGEGRQAGETVVQSKALQGGPTSSSPTTAASQRSRAYSHSTSASAHSSIRASLTVDAYTGGRHASVSSRGTTSTSRTGRELAKLLTEGGDSDIEDILDDLSENQMKKLHQQLEDRLKRKFGVMPVKKKKRT